MPHTQFITCVESMHNILKAIKAINKYTTHVCQTSPSKHALVLLSIIIIIILTLKMLTFQVQCWSKSQWYCALMQILYTKMVILVCSFGKERKWESIFICSYACKNELFSKLSRKSKVKVRATMKHGKICMMLWIT